MPAKKATPTKTDTSELAVLKTGGKQYVVSPGKIITIEKLPGEHKKGDTVVFNQVLLATRDGKSTIGTPLVSGTTVSGVIERVGRLPKVTVIKYKQKSRYLKKNGHQQPYLGVKITAISA